MPAADFKKIQNYTFFAVLIGITFVFIWMVRPYVYPIFWAAVLAALFYPLYKKILSVGKNRSLAAALTESVIILICLIPLLGMISLIIQQAIALYRTIGSVAAIEEMTRSIEAFVNQPLVVQYLGEVDFSTQLQSLGSTLSKLLYSTITTWGQNTARWIIQLFIMLYTLYFFLKDGPMFLKKLMHLLPLGDEYETRLYERFVSTTRATLKGTVLIGIIQGSIGAVALLICGVPGALFWGVIMIVLSIIPAVGVSLILVPVILGLVVTGQWWQASVMIVALTIAGTIDNILRGPLVGKDIQMHPLLIFFSTIGGLLAFGISGVVIGPVITAFLSNIWTIYEERYHQDLVREG